MRPTLQGCEDEGGSKILKDIKAQIRNLEKKLSNKTSRDPALICILH